MAPLSATVSWLQTGLTISPGLWSVLDALLVLITRSLKAAVVNPELLGKRSKALILWLGEITTCDMMCLGNRDIFARADIHTVTHL